MRKANTFLKSIWGLSAKVVTVVTGREFRHGLCVTSLVKKVVTALVTLVTNWLRFGYKVVTAYLAIRYKKDYVNWLQSGYALFRRETGGCNQFPGAIYTPGSFWR
jgi:hypothetical protein